MFRLNLYPEAEEKRRARLAQAGQTALVAFLVALTLILTLFHAGSSVVLADRVHNLETRRAQFEKEIEALKAAGAAKDLPRLQARLASRASRVVWSAKLADLARRIPPALIVDNLAMLERGRGQNVPALSIHGSVLQGSPGAPAPTIVAFVGALKESPVFSAGLASIDLSSVSTDTQTGITSFQILCPVAEAPPAPSEGQ